MADLGRFAWWVREMYRWYWHARTFRKSIRWSLAYARERTRIAGSDRQSWDISRCPDGREHEWRFIGHYGATDTGRAAWGDEIYKVGKCRRCGVGYVTDEPTLRRRA